MADVAFDDVFPAPLERVWRLLEDHRRDDLIPRIHPLLRRQTTLQSGEPESIVERVIDARGHLLTSRWKLTFRPPELYRWDIVSGDGPWEPGSFLESRYSETSGGTRIVSHGRLRISVLPFPLPQGWFVRRVLSDIDKEDRAHLASADRRP